MAADMGEGPVDKSEFRCSHHDGNALTSKARQYLLTFMRPSAKLWNAMLSIDPSVCLSGAAGFNAGFKVLPMSHEAISPGGPLICPPLTWMTV